MPVEKIVCGLVFSAILFVTFYATACPNDAGRIMEWISEKVVEMGSLDSCHRKLRTLIFRYVRYLGTKLPPGQSFENPKIEAGYLVVDRCMEAYGEKIVSEKKILADSGTSDPGRAIVKILERILRKNDMKTPEELELFLESGGW